MIFLYILKSQCVILLLNLEYYVVLPIVFGGAILSSFGS